MKRFELTHRPYDPSLERTKAKESDTLNWLVEPGIYCVDGEPAVIYGRFMTAQPEMLNAIRSIPFHQEKRTVAGGNINSGVRIATSLKDGLGKSTIFGNRPPIAYNPIGVIPGPCALAHTHPEEHATMCDFGRKMTGIYRAMAPERSARHAKLLEEVLPDYVIPGTLFTSGIVNRNNPLNYHFDKGNFDGVMSCMAVFRRLIKGGDLVVPELGVGFRLEDHTYLLFDGQRYLHGVTPIRRMNSTSYRYSVVYYSLRSMARCESPEAEMKKARKKRVGIERRRV